MTKMATLYFAMAIVCFLIVCEARSQPHMAPTLETPSLTTGLDEVTTSEINTDKQTNGIKKSLAKSILNVILSTICGKGQRFNLKNSQCTSISSVFTHGFGNVGLGKKR
ncbi:uncharacterized protein LOC110464383 [Mizuhopecten yessoensis]|uniref:Uncharacterized protein n=1 Tax=Mizuhopecten yessoensis TaxID=6573 RepID=A0A210PU52_MIZYE|nr:uncharacterized protein LOC110464383 [Mizuhopecten yessoensis]OWF39985.1 hypothetical protein KP79_PYT19672 [Mizuhopecten yessoensis]